MKSTLALAALAAVLPGALAGLCCPSGDKNLCRDGTLGTPCCGYGPCNIFCCRCSTQCRRKGIVRAADNITDTGAEDNVSATSEAFLLADTGSKGYLTLDDYLEYMEVKKNHQMWVDWFKSHDQNGDGKLTVDEAHTKKEETV